MRIRLEEELGEEYASLSLLVEEVRHELKRQGIKVDSEGWQQALELDALLDLLRQGEREKARSRLLGNLKAVRKQV
jgi:RNA:NAD 2'-phosphotransferase (TPT1/KptA family)